jgi:hypothetical protein
VAGLSGKDVLVWTYESLDPYARVRLVHLDGDGQELARTHLDKLVTGVVRFEDAWLVTWSDSEGIHLAKLDAQLELGEAVLDPTTPRSFSEHFAAAGLVAADRGAILLDYRCSDDHSTVSGCERSTLQVRRYSADLALETITDVIQTPSEGGANLVQDAWVDPTDAIYLAVRSFDRPIDPFMSDSDGWLVRVVP